MPILSTLWQVCSVETVPFIQMAVAASNRLARQPAYAGPWVVDNLWTCSSGPQLYQAGLTTTINKTDCHQQTPFSLMNPILLQNRHPPHHKISYLILPGPAVCFSTGRLADITTVISNLCRYLANKQTSALRSMADCTIAVMACSRWDITSLWQTGADSRLQAMTRQTTSFCQGFHHPPRFKAKAQNYYG